MSVDCDRNFDDLAHRFKRNVYDRLKGDIRLAVLRRDLSGAVPGLGTPGEAGDLSQATPPLTVLDAGGGQGQLAVEVARLGHSVDLCDISANMLDLARERLIAASVSDRVRLIHDSIQRVCGQRPARYDIVLCHAVLEWVADPQALIDLLEKAVVPGGFLSLTFYNVNGIVFKNLLRTNFAKVLRDDYRGYRGSLTPTWPRSSEEVFGWLRERPLDLVTHSGIRCFHDYILDPDARLKSPDEQLALELRLSTEEPFRSLARYIHLLYRKVDRQRG